ncbi:MAG: hypothetical protein Q8Q26_13570 [Pseudorhodobacter sp.]|nr:hypothetical protein [Pseudorhodobacter sp.]
MYSSGLYQNNIKQSSLSWFKVNESVRRKEKNMGFIEGLGAVASSIGPSLTGAATAVESGAAGAAAATPIVGGLGGLGKLGKLGEFRGFGEAGGLGIVNEGPVGLADLQATAPWQASVDVVSQAEAVVAQVWNPSAMPSVIVEAETILFQAQKPEILSPVTPGPFSVIPSEEKAESRNLVLRLIR